MLQVYQAETGSDIHNTRLLFKEYAASLGVNLSFQGFEEELAGLPGDYALPEGRLLLARYEGVPAGCVALRRLEPGVCEMKRLYVRPGFRGHHVGKALVEEVIAAARTAGYTSMRLDTLPTMGRAQELYREFGFVEIEAYRYNPVEGTVYMELIL
jgi:putative acetyltransferase